MSFSFLWLIEIHIMILPLVYQFTVFVLNLI